MTPTEALKQYFGYSTFRPGQLAIINTVLSKKDTLAVLPTGGGKSICFQIPALLLPGTTIVISPLISLMQDQVDGLVKRGIPATFLNSSLPQSEYQKRLNTFSRGLYKLVYVAPERLRNAAFLKAARTLAIPLLVIDEAHCISEWGHDFRPHYRQITNFADQLARRPTITAFTATATPEVRADIINSLHLKQPAIHLASFKRINLQIQVLQTPNRTQQELHLLRFLRKHQNDTGIVYAATRAATEYLAELINYFEGKTVASAYHGGMEQQQRAKIQDDFMADRCRIITATNAFGMGVDKANIRFVIHYHPSTSIENYYQEIGRAGRDGLDSDCYLLFNPFNLRIHNELIEKNPDPNVRLRNTLKLQAMIHFAQSSKCRNSFLMDYFGETAAVSCTQCDNCKKRVEEVQNPHPLLLSLTSQSEQTFLKQLFDRRAELAAQHHLKPAEILTDVSLCYLALIKPHHTQEFAKIPGIGTGWIQKWQQHFSEI